jgi:hypothetical protein
MSGQAYLGNLEEKILSVYNTGETRVNLRTFDSVGRDRSRERGSTASH